MYTAIGKNTKKIYGIAETKSDLIRNLKETYPFQALADGCYPEAILIEKNNTDVNKLNNMNRNELISLMMNYLDNPEIEKFIKATLKTEKKKKKRFRKGVKILVTFPDGNKKEFGSMGLAAREIGINWNTIKYYLIAEKPDKEGRTYERIEEADEKEQE